MNTSMDEENSISPAGPQGRQAAATGPEATQGVNGATTSPDPDSSWYEYPDASGTGTQQQGDTSGAVLSDTEEVDAEGECDGDGDAKSETSSAMYDPEVDPEGFAKRLDELAGTLEVGQEEARALRWGPYMGDNHIPQLSIPDFKALVNHHLDNTEWKYAMNQDGLGGNGGIHEMSGHPIGVIGPIRIEADMVMGDIDTAGR